MRQEEPQCLGVGPDLRPLLELAFSLPQVLKGRNPKPISCVFMVAGLWNSRTMGPESLFRYDERGC